MNDVFSDLLDEADDLAAVLEPLEPEDWEAPTPSPGWTVADQIAHLSFVVDLAALAGRRDPAFDQARAAAGQDFQAAADRMLEAYRGEPDLLGRWRERHAAAVGVLAAVPAGELVPWLVNPMPAAVLAAAGLLETFAHGQDIRDALGVRAEYTDRVGHLAFFGTRTRDFGYLALGLEPPAEEFRFDLTGPSGVVWTFGPEDAEQRIRGLAVDFALLVSRRRHRDDLALTAEGEEADRWLGIAQAYRGPRGADRRAGQFNRPRRQPLAARS
jgi:uncharacterized protein (TIGR03084 family)